jgi:hypothetical protein
VLRLVVLLISVLISFSSFSFEQSGIVNFDSWYYNTDKQVRYLPNYSTPDEGYKNSNTFTSVYYKANHSIDKLTMTLAAFHTSEGNNKVTRADISYRPLNGMSLNIGILPYRVSQCRYFESDNIWISEPDNFCKFHGLNEISEGSAGIQLGYSSYIKGYVVDSLIGYYDAEIDGQSKKLSIYVPVGHNKYNRKKGFSVRATGENNQISFGYLATSQFQYDESGVKYPFDRVFEYDTYYLGYEHDISKLTLRATISAYIGEGISKVRPTKFYAISNTAELQYHLTHKLSINAFYAKYTSTTVYYPDDYLIRKEQVLLVPSNGVSMRYDFDRSFIILQLYNTKSDSTLASGKNTTDSARAIGIRYGVKF